MSLENNEKKIISADVFAKKTNKFETNLSGKGKKYTAPVDVTNKFNWGAFLSTWIWGLAHKAYLPIAYLGISFSLIRRIPILGIFLFFIVTILFGVKGNKWAWQNKYYNSIDAFHESQKKWAIAGICIFLINIILVTALMFFCITKINNMKNGDIERALYRLDTITTEFSKKKDEKCELSSDGIAKCFIKYMGSFCKIDGNEINDVYDHALLTFYGNGKCQNKNDCKVTIQYIFDISKKDYIELPLYVDSNGYIYIDKNDLNNFIEKYKTSE